MVAGLAIALASGGDVDDAGTAVATSKNAVENNRLRLDNPNEINIISQLAKDDINKQNVLLIAICALTHCAAQFKENSPEYDVWHNVETLGASDEYAEYRTQLQDKARKLALSDAEFEENIHSIV